MRWKSFCVIAVGIHSMEIKQKLKQSESKSKDPIKLSASYGEGKLEKETQLYLEIPTKNTQYSVSYNLLQNIKLLRALYLLLSTSQIHLSKVLVASEQWITHLFLRIVNRRCVDCRVEATFSENQRMTSLYWREYHQPLPSL